MTELDAVRAYRDAWLRSQSLHGHAVVAAADAAIAEAYEKIQELDDKLMEAEGAHENARRWFEEQKKQFARAEKAEAELGELDSYNGHLKWMDKHYPLDVSYFAEGEDVGCQVMRMSRKVMASEAALAKCEQQVKYVKDTGKGWRQRAEKAEAEAARLRCCGNCEHRDEETLDYYGSYFVCLTEFKPKTNMRHMEVDCEDHCHFAPSRWKEAER